MCCLAGWRLRVDQEERSVEGGEGQGGLEGTGQKQDGVDEGTRALGSLDGTWRAERVMEVCRTRGQRHPKGAARIGSPKWIAMKTRPSVVWQDGV